VRGDVDQVFAGEPAIVEEVGGNTESAVRHDTADFMLAGLKPRPTSP